MWFSSNKFFFYYYLVNGPSRLILHYRPLLTRRSSDRMPPGKMSLRHNFPAVRTQYRQQWTSSLLFESLIPYTATYSLKIAYFLCLASRLVTSPATAKSKSKSTLSGQVQVRVQVLFKKGKSKSKSKSSRKKRTCKQFYPIPILFLLLLLSKTLYRTQKKN